VRIVSRTPDGRAHRDNESDRLGTVEHGRWCRGEDNLSGAHDSRYPEGTAPGVRRRRPPAR